jgi:Iodothyronine deiodinase
LGALEELWRRHRDEVAFFVVYIKEAHPEDGWVLDRNRRADVRVADPASTEERVALAETCALRLRIDMPVVIDSMDNAVASAYGAWPDRLYLIGRDGRVAFRGGPGPFGFVAADLEAAIAAELEAYSVPNTRSPASPRPGRM